MRAGKACGKGLTMTEEKIGNAEQPKKGSAEEKEDISGKDGIDSTAKDGERGEGARRSEPERSGKFRSTGELRRAYEALEAEFTRKSQQLADLKREHELLARQEEIRRTVEEFIRIHPKAAGMKAELTERVSGTGMTQGQSPEAAYMDILEREYRSSESLMEDEQFLQSCAGNEKLRQMIIRGFLEQARSGNSPTVLSGGYIPIRGRNRARTLEDAGKMTRGLYEKR